jgi:hypothetical protein
MSKRNTRAAKAARRKAREAERELRAIFPAYLESDEAYLDHVLNAPDAELTDKQRQLRDEIRAHHPELLPG